MTKRENYVAIRELVKDNADFVAFIDKELAAMDAKAEKTKARRSEKVAVEGEAIKIHAVDILTEVGRPITLAELAGAMGDAYTVGKIVYHIRPLVEDGTIVKEPIRLDGRKLMTYRVA